MRCSHGIHRIGEGARLRSDVVIIIVIVPVVVPDASGAVAGTRARTGPGRRGVLASRARPGAGPVATRGGARAGVVGGLPVLTPTRGAVPSWLTCAVVVLHGRRLRTRGDHAHLTGRGARPALAASQRVAQH